MHTIPDLQLPSRIKAEGTECAAHRKSDASFPVIPLDLG